MCVCLCSEPNSPTSVWSGHQNNGHMRITWQKQIKKCKQIVHWLHWSEIGENHRTSTTGPTWENFQKFGETSMTLDVVLNIWTGQKIW